MKPNLRKKQIILATVMSVLSSSAFAGFGQTLKNKFTEGADEMTIVAAGVAVVALVWGAIQMMFLKIPVSKWLYPIFIGAVIVVFAPDIVDWFMKK